VHVKAQHRLWTRATAFRPTLSHLFRRHLRYYSAFACPERDAHGRR